MPIFPNFNYEYIVSAYRQLREKYFCQRYCIIAAVIFLICIIGILFFIIQNDDASTRQNIDEVPTQTSPPLPTEIDPNFL
ncbi:hypothetical protein KJ853_04185, partial [Patescibacteria group bacterium]|nr:hypothetical protein [Patescibacteria group bacterium]